MKAKVSVVVAAYNVELFLYRCLESLQKQTLQEIEVLIINDGSTDRTEEIAKLFEVSDNRFKVISQINGGLSAARNTGIKSASADYIAFLDGDDYVDQTMYEKLYRKMIGKSSDLSICGFHKVWETVDFEEVKRKSYHLSRSHLKGNIIENFLARHDEPFVVAWNKLYKKEIITKNNIYFENRAFFEDVGFIPRYLYYVEGISIIEENLLFYIQRAGSITSSYNPIIESSFSQTVALLKSFFKDREDNKEYLSAMELRLLIYWINYCLRNKKGVNDLIKQVISKRKSVRLLPLKHRVAVILMRLGLYEKIASR
ncbi:glycosyltransferase family 2 protein [Salinibacillus xinjiangensis]|uniref:Glycosyltransferase n=1 Tax=Salinibacillus xinjiangensis TaxID=1229268 RepID=A0A6G1X2A0_9BACI|nr:glycosyltransferase [Salinibacillus xinjiangensis]MRG85072.1 glycosyltransferase [Salinibacillus xinjiangensis]